MINKKKNNSGNTLIIVLVILLIVAIISMGVMFSVAYTSNYRMNRSIDSINYVTMENKMYDGFNTTITNSNNDVKEKLTSYFTFTPESEWEIIYTFDNNINEPSSNELVFEFSIHKKNNDLCLEGKVTFTINGGANNTYEVKKWGESKWN